jgi:hypothetical protein
MTTAKRRLFYVMFPADGVPLGPIPAENEEEVRAWARSFEGVTRLPRGVQIWETTQAELDAIVENNRRMRAGVPFPVD